MNMQEANKSFDESANKLRTRMMQLSDLAISLERVGNGQLARELVSISDELEQVSRAIREASGAVVNIYVRSAEESSRMILEAEARARGLELL